jgi:hypothetical protein
MTPDPHRGYRLGHLFIVLEVLTVVTHGSNLASGDPLVAVQIIGAMWSLALAAAAGTRQPWGWHMLLAGLLGRIGFRLFALASYVEHYGWPPLWSLFITVPLWLTDLLWFAYFYRRRTTFGADRRWPWVERLGLR